MLHALLVAPATVIKRLPDADDEHASGERCQAYAGVVYIDFAAIGGVVDEPVGIAPFGIADEYAAQPRPARPRRSDECEIAGLIVAIGVVFALIGGGVRDDLCEIGAGFSMQ